MSWLLAWLIAIIFVWRLLVAMPEIKTERRQLVCEKRSLVTDRT
jgi:hypothetical protein